MAEERFRLNLDDVALGDIEDFETYTGQPFMVLNQLSDEAFMATASARLFTGLALLMLRQDDPEATVEDARRIKISDLNPTTAEPVDLPRLQEPVKARRVKTTGA